MPANSPPLPSAANSVEVKPDPERVTEADLFTPAELVRTIVKGAEKRFKTRGEQLESLNLALDAFDAQLGKVPAHLRNQDPGSQFVEKAMTLLQAEIEQRDPQRSLLLTQVAQTREALP
jgi:hypothetical protein